MAPLLVAAVPEAPAHLPEAGGLGIAWEEAELLPRRFGQGATVLLDAEATRAAVLAALPTHPYVHFSCHGGPALHLHDGELRLSDLLSLDLSRAHLAVLSTCETAYLGTAFHMLGYRHVVAALWPVRDESSLILGACVSENPWGPANAIHDAARWLREKNPHDPTAWVPYVHIGA